MTEPTRKHLHTPSALAGALIALAGIGVGALLTSGTAMPHALAVAPDTGSGIPAIELDKDTTALVVDNRGMVFVVDQTARAFPVRYDEQSLRNVPGEEILRAR